MLCSDQHRGDLQKRILFWREACDLHDRPNGPPLILPLARALVNELDCINVFALPTFSVCRLTGAVEHADTQAQIVTVAAPHASIQLKHCMRWLAQLFSSAALVHTYECSLALAQAVWRWKGPGGPAGTPSLEQARAAPSLAKMMVACLVPVQT